MRTVGHLDLDYFYAQVEEVENPSLRDLPVLVCVYSGRTEDSGVVSTANYRARSLGVRSGMPIYLAKKRTEGTNAVFIPMKHEKYEAYSERIMALVRAEVDVLEQTGIDEAFFDTTQRTGGDFAKAREIAVRLKDTVLGTERLTCSIGVAPNKVVAKLASDLKKPDGLVVVEPDAVEDFMYPLPVDKLYGVGQKMAKLLYENGITTIGELAREEGSKIEKLVGTRTATYLLNASRGIDEEAVTERSESIQISRMITLKRDTQITADILPQLAPVVEDVERRVTERALFFRTVTVIGILPNLAIRSRSRTLDAPTNSRSTLDTVVAELLDLLVSNVGNLRRVGVKVSDLTTAIHQSSMVEFL